jgi:hypothetical protein
MTASVEKSMWIFTIFIISGKNAINIQIIKRFARSGEVKT